MKVPFEPVETALDNGSLQATMTLDLGALGMRIKKLRERRKLSQEALAARAGIHRVSLANVERGAKQPTLDTLERLARALGVPVARFLSGKGGR